MRQGLLAPLFICFSLVACGGGGGGGSGRDDAPSYRIAPGEASVITFDDTARLELASTSAAQALSISVEVNVAAEQTQYQLQPTGTQMLTPARLFLPLPENSKNQRYSVARNVDGQWRPLLSSVQSEAGVTASITQFGDYRLVPTEAPGVARVINGNCEAQADEQSLRFVHVADLHARYGGPEKLFSRIKAYHRQALEEQPYTVFSNGGDDFEKGSVAELLSAGAATVEVTKAMAFDVRVIGNHDFAWGADTLLNHAQDPIAQVIASNSEYRGGSAESFGAQGFAVLQVGCLKVGFFGMSSGPWNELDEPLETAPIPDFVPDFKMNWHSQHIAEGVVSQYREHVDVLVMLSHLGASADREILLANPGIDLALGGHSHLGTEFEQLASGNILIQPDFFADGLSDVTLRYRLSDKRLLDASVDEIQVRDIAEPDAATQQVIDGIVQKYSPDAHVEIALAEDQPSAQQLTALAAKAALYHHGADAALLDPSQVIERWLPGTVTATEFHRALPVERQPADTPGFKAFYEVSVSGAELAEMRAAQPSWVFVSSQAAESDPIKLVLYKSAAWNLPLFFPNLADRSATYLSESWASLDAYARQRSSDCLYLDIDKTLSRCQPDTVTTTWQFHSDEQPLREDAGPSRLSYLNVATQADTQFGLPTDFGLPELAGGDSVVMAFDAYSPEQGLKLQANVPANGDLAEQGKLSDYSLVMDILWPEGSDGFWRAIMQTTPNNDDDADIFFEASASGGVGIASAGSGYFGEFRPGKWHRLGLVFYAGGDGGSFKAYLDGELIGAKAGGDIGERWAIVNELLLLTDNSFETEKGYMNALLFSGRALSDSELNDLGAAKQNLRLQPNAQQLQQRIQRHLHH